MLRIIQLIILIVIGSLVAATAATSGTVVVSAGNTLKVHSQPSTTSSTIYNLANGTVVTITCAEVGETISGSQGTTNQWDQIDSSTYGTGYASHAYIYSSDDTAVASCSTGDANVTGTVSVAEGATLKVHSTPSTSSSVLYNLDNHAVVAITCVTTGDSVSGSQGTTSDWYQLEKGGYTSAAYIAATTGTPVSCAVDPVSSSTFQQALNYGTANIGTLYTGCAGGDYRFGKVAESDKYFDGTTCGQSRVYFEPAGAVGFDCSGLMVMMFDAAGIYLPYQSSTAIKDNVPQVSKSDLQQGDMLAKYGHVVMWIGSGQVIESTPFAQNSDSSWTGTRINSDTSYINSADYTAHRYPGLY